MKKKEVKKALLECIEKTTGVKQWTVAPLCDLANDECKKCIVTQVFGVTCYGYNYGGCVDDLRAPCIQRGKQRVDSLKMMFAMLAAALDINLGGLR